MADRVLVTGISGFIAAHVTQRLIAKGYKVRGTLRNKDKGEALMARFAASGVDTQNIELAEADLGHDAGWKDAVQDCRYIQHIASPFPLEAPRDREALVPEARAGAMRVLEQGLGAGAERVVLTSSVVAMIGRAGRKKHVHIQENDWSDPEWKPMSAYPVSKTRAEQSAWAYVKAQGLEDKLTTVCPGLVLGPDTYQNGGASLSLIRTMFKGEFPRVPKVAYPIVDVRDCAAIHVTAMTAKDAAGRRLIASGGTIWMAQIADILREAYPQAKGLPKGDLPNFVLRIVGLFDDRLKSVTPDLGIFHEADNAYVSSITQVMPRPPKESILAAAESMIANGDVDTPA